MEVLGGYLTEIIMAVVTCIATTIAALVVKRKFKQATDAADREIQRQKDEAAALAKSQKDEYDRLIAAEKDRNYRAMILKELEPIVDEITTVKQNINDHFETLTQYIKTDEKEFEVRLGALKEYHISDRDEIAEEINDRTRELERKLLKIVESYKFRFIQLCKTHLDDGYITSSGWEQIVNFYDVYHGLGGNGQAEDYYNRVKELEVIPDAEDPKNA